MDRYGIYSTNSAYKHLEKQAMEQQNQSTTEVEAFKLLWKCKIPSKVLAFTWQLLKGKLPTKMNLIRREIQVTNEEHNYVFCDRCAEN